MGDVIADAMLAATAPTDFGGAVAAFMNPGGSAPTSSAPQIPVGEHPCKVTYDQTFTVQPFSNTMVVKTMTGQQIYDVLAQQFNNPSAGAPEPDHATCRRNVRLPLRRPRRRRRHDHARLGEVRRRRVDPLGGTTASR